MKKFWGVVIAVIGAGLLFVIGSVLVMFLAPGTEIFGIRYVASGTSKCDIAEPLQNFTGNLYIDTKNVPIEIDFTDSTSFGIEFRQNFVGFTKSKQRKANLDITYSDNGDLHLTANEIEEFAYSQKADTFYKFKLTIPSLYFQSPIRSVYITSKTSSVNITGNANVKDFSVETDGALTIADGNKITVAGVYKNYTSKLIEINDKLECFSCDLKSTGNNINISNPIVGDIFAKTSGGDLKFVSCRNLKFTSTSGSVKTYGEGLNTVAGNVEISTNGGSVELGEVNTLLTGDSNIYNTNEILTTVKTEGGSIRIKKMHTGTISSTRGRMNIDEVYSATVNSKTGNVVVKTIKNSITVNGRNGKVTLGDGGECANPVVSTTTGEITIYEASGKADITSKNNSIYFNNKDSNDIKLSSGKVVNASYLKGKVNIYAKNDIYAQFTEISDNVTIESGTKADKVEINATCVKITDVDYYAKSSKGSKCRVYSGDTLVGENSTLSSERTTGHYLIKVETSYAEVIIKFNSEKTEQTA